MRRRPAASLLATLIVLTLVAPASAAEPSATLTPDPAPSTQPTPSLEPTPEPTAEPAPSAPVVVPTPTPAVEPARLPHLLPQPPTRSSLTHLLPRTAASTPRAGTSSCSRAGSRPPRPSAGPRRAPASTPVARSRARSAASRPSSTPASGARSSPTPRSWPSCPDEIVHLAAQTIPNGVRRVGAKQSTVAFIDGLGPARRRGRRDRRHGRRAAPGPQHRRRVQLLQLGPLGLGRQQRPRHARGRHGRGARQRLRGRWGRAGCPHLGRQDPQRRRLRLPVLVRLRPRLDPRPARRQHGPCSRP